MIPKAIIVVPSRRTWQYRFDEPCLRSVIGGLINGSTRNRAASWKLVDERDAFAGLNPPRRHEAVLDPFHRRHCVIRFMKRRRRRHRL